MSFKRRRKRSRDIALPEVTLTPLIDTALTLLIIFMVTTPMMYNAVKVDLPSGTAKEGGKEPERVVVAIDKDEHMFVNNEPVSLKDLGSVIKVHLQKLGQDDQRVWVRIDKKNSCDTLIQVIDCIKVVGGVKDVAVVTHNTQKVV